MREVFAGLSDDARRDWVDSRNPILYPTHLKLDAPLLTRRLQLAYDLSRRHGVPLEVSDVRPHLLLNDEAFQQAIRGTIGLANSARYKPVSRHPTLSRIRQRTEEGYEPKKTRTQVVMPDASLAYNELLEYAELDDKQRLAAECIVRGFKPEYIHGLLTERMNREPFDLNYFKRVLIPGVGEKLRARVVLLMAKKGYRWMDAIRVARGQKKAKRYSGSLPLAWALMKGKTRHVEALFHAASLSPMEEYTAWLRIVGATQEEIIKHFKEDLGRRASRSSISQNIRRANDKIIDLLYQHDIYVTSQVDENTEGFKIPRLVNLACHLLREKYGDTPFRVLPGLGRQANHAE
ncbi:hypothetical protein HY572_06905 [Candidatus Micrarchaeota archaeon]|nr:hypothetical protein [Candidatus Micrarchaeota archaeon]